ncbi:MAG: pseudouridine synthase [Euryarchaeota archaeon]|nr:pseudouridine synthase [Euryarchaeota archaeon]
MDPLRRVRAIADYQFGPGSGPALFPDTCTFQWGSSGRIRQVLDAGGRIATLRARDGVFTLGFEGARRLHRHHPAPRLRVTVQQDVAEFIARGSTLFARHVVSCDPSIRLHQEVLVVDPRDELLATGTALLSPREMADFKRGPAVRIRAHRDETASPGKTDAGSPSGEEA